MSRTRHCAFVAAATLFAVVTGSFSPVAAVRDLATAPQAAGLLGFEIGEELRYVLAPESALLRGEHAMWSIRLDEVHAGEDGAPEGVFALRHEWEGPQPIADPPLRRITRVVSEGTVRVNAHGFPLFIRYQTVRHLAGLGDEAYTIDYALDEDHRAYEKRTTLDGDRWYQTVPIRDHDIVRRNPPSGLFAYLPAAPGCGDLYAATYEDVVGAAQPQPRSADSTQGAQVPAPQRIADNADCEESLFGNPGLLGFALPALWEARGQKDYVFFTPIGPTSKPASGVTVGAPQGTGGMPVPSGGMIGSPRAGGGFPARMPTVAGETLSPSTYHEVRTLRFVERVTIRVGTRTRDAWRIEISDDSGALYVDNDGVVLRIDLPSPADGPQRHIRRLWPSEF